VFCTFQAEEKEKRLQELKSSADGKVRLYSRLLWAVTTSLPSNVLVELLLIDDWSLIPPLGESPGDALEGCNQKCSW